MSATSGSPQVLMTRRERREAEEREREAALRASGRSGDTVVVGGIRFHGPAPISPALGNLVVPPSGVSQPPVLGDSVPAPAVPELFSRLAAAPAPVSRPVPARAPVSAPASVSAPAPVSAPAAVSTPAPVLVPAPTSLFGAAPVPAPRPEPELPADLRSRAERSGRPEPAPRTRSAWLPRVAVLGALAAATIAAPLAPLGSIGGGGGSSPFDLDLAPVGPSTLDVVRNQAAAPATAPGIAAAPVVVRAAAPVSRSEDRDPLPGCAADTVVTSTNGHLTDAELCDLPFAAGFRLQPRAAVALTALNEAFKAEFGTDIGLVDSYRSLSRQYSVKESRGYLAARPGTSMHGFGLAIDLSSAVTGNSAAYKWLVENGAAYGWENPPWARRGGAGNYEPWHFEFRPGVEEVSTWH
ncbi:D-alanyl-D-alanine carboxypeptidase family protein [Xylanimonas sp. McL0601]|uniref:M15 family metallopeptidase n=1 Tax=Xylanimonas sp. McL0601 TaxID=3414739 RepID=UPI003CF0A8D9